MSVELNNYLEDSYRSPYRWVELKIPSSRSDECLEHVMRSVSAVTRCGVIAPDVRDRPDVLHVQVPSDNFEEVCCTLGTRFKVIGVVGHSA